MQQVMRDRMAVAEELLDAAKNETAWISEAILRAMQVVVLCEIRDRLDTIGDRMEYVRAPEGHLATAHQECYEKAEAKEAARGVSETH